MSTDPNDYDPNELRGGSKEPESVFLGSGGNGGMGGRGGFGDDDGASTNQYRELFLLQQTSGGAGPERPYLDSLPRSYAAEVVVFEWLGFLVEKAGFRRTIDAFRYYRSIQWMTEDVEAGLREYLTSFDGDGSRGELDHADHLQSLVYIARLASMD